MIPWNDRKDYPIPQLFESVKKVNSRRWALRITHEPILNWSIIGFRSVVEVVWHTLIGHPGHRACFRGLKKRPFVMINRRVTEKWWSAELHVSPVWRATAGGKIVRKLEP